MSNQVKLVSSCACYDCISDRVTELFTGELSRYKHQEVGENPTEFEINEAGRYT